MLHMLAPRSAPKHSVAIREYYRRYRDQNASTADCARSSSRYPARNWRLFSQAHARGRTEDRRLVALSAGPQGRRSDGHAVETAEPFRLPIEIGVARQGWRAAESRPHRAHGRTATKTFKWRANRHRS